MIEAACVSARLEEAAGRARICTACPLSRMRKNVVYGVGNPASPLCLVGEGPGEHEDATGQPFVGRAGALLDRALRENALSRSDVYICNVVKCRAQVIEGGRARNRPPELSEVQACSPWLDEQLGIIAPRVVLCLGAPSAKAIIKPNFQITSERGRFFTCRYAAWAMAAFHPAYILRQAGAPFEEGFRSLAGDLALAWEKARETQEPEPRPSEARQLSLF
jgi:uracil-DNA glycosylase family 4